jgi:hypothetical protein
VRAIHGPHPPSMQGSRSSHTSWKALFYAGRGPHPLASGGDGGTPETGSKPGIQ